eukprot:738066-Hanusia_phi.AAC.1
MMLATRRLKSRMIHLHWDRAAISSKLASAGHSAMKEDLLSLATRLGKENLNASPRRNRAMQAEAETSAGGKFRGGAASRKYQYAYRLDDERCGRGGGGGRQGRHIRHAEHGREPGWAAGEDKERCSPPGAGNTNTPTHLFSPFLGVKFIRQVHLRRPK